MEIDYRKCGDYYIPNLVVSNTNNFKLGKYGKMRLNYLKTQKKAEYTILLMDDKLSEHLQEIDDTTTARYNLLIKQFAEQENIIEELKAINQLEWVGKMNSIKNRVEEIIFRELIYVYGDFTMEEKLKPFIEEYSDDFYESIEDIRQYLMKNNKNYREIKNKIHKIMDRNLNIQKLLDETYLENGLNAGECKGLSQIIVLYNNLQDILEKEIYFKGGMNSYYYFKRIGVIN